MSFFRQPVRVRPLASPIEIIEVREEFGSASFTVVYGGRFADRLGRDEAVGLVNSLFFGADGVVPYLHTYAQWLEQQCRYHADEQPKIAGLLTYRGVDPDARVMQALKIEPRGFDRIIQRRYREQ
jgi:hypothetical protein